jgi:hypothetical protein
MELGSVTLKINNQHTHNRPRLSGRKKPTPDAWWEEEEGQEYIKKHFNLQKIAKYFRTRSPVSAADVDGWRARELMAPLFMGDDEELQALIRDHLIIPHLFRDFQPSHVQEYAGGLLFALEKPAKDGGYPAHHLRRKLASLLRQPRCQRRPGSYLSYFYIHIRKLFTNCRSPGWRFPLRQDSFFAKILSSM